MPSAGRPFATIHVDDLGYPIHGHLAWASASWWVGQFQAAGFERELAVERALHTRYDALHGEASAGAPCVLRVLEERLAGDGERRFVDRIAQGRVDRQRTSRTFEGALGGSACPQPS